jgi:hypothetical protein
VLRIEHHLGLPVPVAEVDEYDASEIPAHVNPPVKGHFLTDAVGAQFTACVCTFSKSRHEHLLGYQTINIAKNGKSIKLERGSRLRLAQG